MKTFLLILNYIGGVTAYLLMLIILDILIQHSKITNQYVIYFLYFASGICMYKPIKWLFN